MYYNYDLPFFGSKMLQFINGATAGHMAAWTE